MYRFILLIALLFFFSCDKKSAKEELKTDSLTVIQKDSSLQAGETLEETPENAPEWYTDIPKRDGYLYITASARSKRASIAQDKAEHIAHVLMAEKIEKLKSASSAANGGTNSEDEITFNKNLQHSIIIKSKRVKEGGYWRAFVLLKMKTTMD